MYIQLATKVLLTDWAIDALFNKLIVNFAKVDNEKYGEYRKIAERMVYNKGSLFEIEEISKKIRTLPPEEVAIIVHMADEMLHEKIKRMSDKLDDLEPDEDLDWKTQ